MAAPSYGIPVRHSRGPPNPNPNPNPNARPREWRTPGMGGRYQLWRAVTE